MRTLSDKITITNLDQNRLQNFFTKKQNPFEFKDNIKILEEKLRSAVVDSKKVDAKVVTMNSKVKIKNLLIGKSFTFQLVYPNEVDISKKKISIFSPIGASMFGHSEGEEFSWVGSNGKNRFIIEKIIYQPESAGDFHL